MLEKPTLLSLAPRINCMNNKINIRICNQIGSSLLETMVSLFVLAIGLLGTLAMQTKSIQHNQNSYSYSQAIVLATDLSERLKNTANAVDDIVAWKKSVADNLPAGEASITGTDKGTIQEITIKFKETGGVADKTGKSHEIKFRTWL